MPTALREILTRQDGERDRLKKGGHICPFVFFREVAEERGGDKKPQPIKRYNKVWRKACIAAGCPGRLPHDLRRTAVRTFVRAGISERVAQQISGHKTRSVFDRYDIISGDDMAGAAAKLDAMNGLPAEKPKRARKGDLA